MTSTEKSLYTSTDCKDIRMFDSTAKLSLRLSTEPTRYSSSTSKHFEIESNQINDSTSPLESPTVSTSK
uniref:Uncharacterized protein n=1 Tax=Strongyloides papillosus TaxID=174720 RepID=A0A0N5BZ49_STREA